MSVSVMPRAIPRADIEAGHCGTPGCTCTHRNEDPDFPEAPACDRGMVEVRVVDRARRGVPVARDAVRPCVRCRGALAVWQEQRAAERPRRRRR